MMNIIVYYLIYLCNKTQQLQFKSFIYSIVF